MKRTILFLLMTFPLAQTFAQGQVISKNLSLASLVDYQTLYGSQSIDPTQVETLTDLATWRDSRNGKEYALVGLSTDGSGSGVAMVDVTNPANPLYVKTIRRSGPEANTIADIQVYNNFAYIAQNWSPSYWVNLIAAVDNPTNPTAGYGGDITTTYRIHNLFVNKDQNLLFLSVFGVDNDSIRVYDISGVPTSGPVFKGRIYQILSNARSHDLYARKINSTQGRVFDASLRGITVSDYTWSGGTFILGTQRAHQYNRYRGVNPSDFSNPAKIMPLNNRIAHSAWLGAGSNYLFATEEQFGGSNSEPYWINSGSVDYKRGNYLYVWDISNIDAPADQNNFRYPIKQVYEVRETSDNGALPHRPMPFSPSYPMKRPTVSTTSPREEPLLLIRFTPPITPKASAF